MAKTLLKTLATMLQTPKSFSWDLQRCCKHQKVFRETCNGVANAKKFFVRLATVLQTPKSFSRDLQRCCKRQKVFRGTCNGVANAKKFFGGLATVLQVTKSTFRHLRNFRGAFPKTLWSLQRSIQAILQGLGASFFRSSSRCKDFWKERSAVEGIRFAPIDRWEAIRSCDLYPKCRSDPATHFRPRWTGHRIANGFPPFQTAPTFAALKT